jgi:positive regulator of sigma E activity
MKEEGTVVSINGNSVLIEISPHEECTKCCSCGANKPRQVTVSGEKAKELKVGDRVRVEIDPSIMMKLYMVLYAVPLGVFVAVVLLLFYFSGAPLLSFSGAIVCTAGSYFVAGRLIGANPAFAPEITVIQPADRKPD